MKSAHTYAVRLLLALCFALSVALTCAAVGASPLGAFERPLPHSPSSTSSASQSNVPAWFDHRAQFAFVAEKAHLAHSDDEATLFASAKVTLLERGLNNTRDFVFTLSNPAYDITGRVALTPYWSKTDTIVDNFIKTNSTDDGKCSAHLVGKPDLVLPFTIGIVRGAGFEAKSASFHLIASEQEPFHATEDIEIICEDTWFDYTESEAVGKGIEFYIIDASTQLSNVVDLEIVEDEDQGPRLFQTASVTLIERGLNNTRDFVFTLSNPSFDITGRVALTPYWSRTDTIVPNFIRTNSTDDGKCFARPLDQPDLILPFTVGVVRGAGPEASGASFHLIASELGPLKTQESITITCEDTWFDYTESEAVGKGIEFYIVEDSSKLSNVVDLEIVEDEDQGPRLFQTASVTLIERGLNNTRDFVFTLGNPVFDIITPITFAPYWNRTDTRVDNFIHTNSTDAVTCSAKPIAAETILPFQIELVHAGGSEAYFKLSPSELEPFYMTETVEITCEDTWFDFALSLAIGKGVEFYILEDSSKLGNVVDLEIVEDEVEEPYLFETANVTLFERGLNNTRNFSFVLSNPSIEITGLVAISPFFNRTDTMVDNFIKTKDAEEAKCVARPLDQPELILPFTVLVFRGAGAAAFHLIASEEHPFHTDESITITCENTWLDFTSADAIGKEIEFYVRDAASQLTSVIDLEIVNDDEPLPVDLFGVAIANFTHVIDADSRGFNFTLGLPVIDITGSLSITPYYSHSIDVADVVFTLDETGSTKKCTAQAPDSDLIYPFDIKIVRSEDNTVSTMYLTASELKPFQADQTAVLVCEDAFLNFSAARSEDIVFRLEYDSVYNQTIYLPEEEDQTELFKFANVTLVERGAKNTRDFSFILNKPLHSITSSLTLTPYFNDTLDIVENIFQTNGINEGNCYAKSTKDDLVLPFFVDIIHLESPTQATLQLTASEDEPFRNTDGAVIVCEHAWLDFGEADAVGTAIEFVVKDESSKMTMKLPQIITIDDDAQPEPEPQDNLFKVLQIGLTKKMDEKDTPLPNARTFSITLDRPKFNIADELIIVPTMDDVVLSSLFKKGPAQSGCVARKIGEQHVLPFKVQFLQDGKYGKGALSLIASEEEPFSSTEGLVIECENLWFDFAQADAINKKTLLKVTHLKSKVTQSIKMPVVNDGHPEPEDDIEWDFEITTPMRSHHQPSLTFSVSNLPPAILPGTPLELAIAPTGTTCHAIKGAHAVVLRTEDVNGEITTSIIEITPTTNCSVSKQPLTFPAPRHGTPEQAKLSLDVVYHTGETKKTLTVDFSLATTKTVFKLSAAAKREYVWDKEMSNKYVKMTYTSWIEKKKVLAPTFSMKFESTLTPLNFPIRLSSNSTDPLRGAKAFSLISKLEGDGVEVKADEHLCTIPEYTNVFVPGTLDPNTQELTLDLSKVEQLSKKGQTFTINCTKSWAVLPPPSGTSLSFAVSGTDVDGARSTCSWEMRDFEHYRKNDGGKNRHLSGFVKFLIALFILAVIGAMAWTLFSYFIKPRYLAKKGKNFEPLIGGDEDAYSIQ